MLTVSWVGISLYTEFQLCMLPVSGPKVCGGGGGGGSKPILVLSFGFDRAEQYRISGSMPLLIFKTLAVWNCIIGGITYSSLTHYIYQNISYQNSSRQQPASTHVSHKFKCSELPTVAMAGQLNSFVQQFYSL
jgi:hypothetical protein